MLVPSGIHAKYRISRNAESPCYPRFSRALNPKITHSIPRRPIFCKGFEPQRPAYTRLASVVRASAALPVAFPPCTIKARLTADSSAFLKQKRNPDQMALVDGGVRNNLGTDWFSDPARSERAITGRVLPYPQVSELVVVSAAANCIKPRHLHLHRPFLGELSSLLAISELPYNTREFQNRRALLWQFAAAPKLQYQGGHLGTLGAIIHIAESPCELADELLLWLDNWNAGPERDRELDIKWFLRGLNYSPAVETVDTLDWYVLRDATGRASAVLSAVECAESDFDLAQFELSKIGNYGLSKPRSKRELVNLLWAKRAAANAAVSTSLSSLGTEVSASLLRHGFVLAMAKLHLVLGYPLCKIPSQDEFRRLAGG